MNIYHLRDVLLRSATVAGLLLATCPAWTQEVVNTDVGDIDQASIAKVFPTKRPYSPYAGRNFPTRPLFGDTHLHTALSFDAGAAGAAAWSARSLQICKGRRGHVHRPDSRPNCHVRSISWSSRTIPTIWGGSPTSWPESPRSWQSAQGREMV